VVTNEDGAGGKALGVTWWHGALLWRR
jgi:hypothetical protein